MVRYYKLIFICIVSISIFGCSQNPYERDISDISVSLNYIDFHTEIYSLSETKSMQDAETLAQKCEPFFKSYNQRVLKIGSYKDENYFSHLSQRIHSSLFEELYEEAETQYKDFSPILSKLKDAFSYYTYYFPDYSVPTITTFISGLQYSVIIDEGIVAIGLDKYLGTSYPLYSESGIPRFIQQRMHKDRIPVDCMFAVADGEFPNNFEEEHLLAEMIHHGRLMFLVRSTLPHIDDTLLWNYTQQQLEFCKASEKEFWTYFISTDNMLFKTDYLIIKRFIDEGPFTPTFTKKSPARIGQWLGFNIVESFMNTNSDMSMKDLFEIEDPLYIMNNSGYNP
ncbi:MAG: hypothetical protein R6U95_06420 [Bacteroidales bacterium]